MNSLQGGPGSITSSQFVGMRRQREAQDLDGYDRMDASLVKIPNDAILKSQANLGFEFLLSTFDPWNYAVPAPANVYDPPAIPQKGTLNLTWLVGTDSVVEERIPQSRGIILHLPKLGWNSMWHMGIVPKGAVTASVLNGLNVILAPNIYYEGAIIVPAATVFVYNSELALPYVASDRALAVTPDLAENFNKVRAYAGGIELYGSTISAGTIALNGRCTSAIVNDTRDICQLKNLAFSASSLQSSARNNKEIVMETSLYEGIIQTTGSDLREDYVSTNIYNSDTINGAWTHNASVGNTFGPFSMPLPGAGLASQVGLSADWITPWDISCPNLNGGAYGSRAEWYTASNNPSDTIGEADCFDIHVTFSVGVPLVKQAYANTGVMHAFRAVCTHVYAFVSPQGDGSIEYRTYTYAKLCPFLAYDETGTFVMDFMFEGKPGLGRNGMAAEAGVTDMFQTDPTVAGGKYIGSFISSSIKTTTETGAAVVLAPGYTILPRNYKVRARNIEDIGHVGPAHITRYDGVSANQELRLNAIINTQVVAEADISQFLKTSSIDIRSPANVNVLSMISAIYNSALLPYWKMTWNRAQWARYRDILVEGGPGKLILEITNKAPDSQLMAVSSAAGLFSAIGGGLGHFLDKFTGTASGSFTNTHASNNAGGSFGNSRSGGSFGNY